MISCPPIKKFSAESRITVNSWSAAKTVASLKDRPERLTRDAKLKICVRYSLVSIYTIK